MCTVEVLWQLRDAYSTWTHFVLAGVVASTRHIGRDSLQPESWNPGAASLAQVCRQVTDESNREGRD